MEMKFHDTFKVTSGPTTMMSRCVCGDSFSEHGESSVVSAHYRAWSAQHEHCYERKDEGSKLFWLSFCDGDKPNGSQFLGACIVEVTATEADEMKFEIMLRFPMAQPDAEWIGAASRKAHALGCNPGGEMASVEIEPDNPMLVFYKRGVLMDRPTIEAIDAQIEASR